jgi:hypothetical protein
LNIYTFSELATMTKRRISAENEHSLKARLERAKADVKPTVFDEKGHGRTHSRNMGNAEQ